MANTIDVNAPAISNETVASIAAQATPVTTPVETQVAEPVVNNEVTPEVTQAPAEGVLIGDILAEIETDKNIDDIRRRDEEMTAQISSQVDSQLANTTPITENDLPVSETEQPNENKGDEPSSEIMEVIRQNEARITKLTVDLLKAETALEQALQQKKVEMELRQEQVKDLQSEMAKMSISSIPSDDPQVKNLHYLRQQFKDEKTSEEGAKNLAEYFINGLATYTGTSAADLATFMRNNSQQKEQERDAIMSGGSRTSGTGTHYSKPENTNKKTEHRFNSNLA